MNIVIRKIESKDYIFIAAIWRDVLGLLSATDENVAKTFEKMKGDSRYCTFVADVNGNVVGFTTTVETLAIDQPNGYIKVNGLAVLPSPVRNVRRKAHKQGPDLKSLTPYLLLLQI